MDNKTETLIQVFSDEKLDMISETQSRCLKCYYYFRTLESAPADVDRRNASHFDRQSRFDRRQESVRSKTVNIAYIIAIYQIC